MYRVSDSPADSRQEEIEVFARPLTFGFIPLDRGSLFPLAALLDVIRLANETLEEPRFTPLLLHDGSSPAAEFGFGISARSYGVGDASQLDYCFVLAAEPGAGLASTGLSRHLRRLHRFGTTVGGIGAGVFAIANAGLLDDRKCCADASYFSCFSERFPHLFANQSLFEIDGRCITAAGGIASVDMMLWLLRQWLDRETAETIARRLQLPSVRPMGQEQVHQPTGHLMIKSKSVRRAIEIFQASLDDQVSTVDVATELGISVRQLERLFRKYLGVSPARYLREERLRTARDLLVYTDLSPTEVAHTTGFNSVRHFKKLYRERFDALPVE